MNVYQQLIILVWSAAYYQQCYMYKSDADWYHKQLLRWSNHVAK